MEVRPTGVVRRFPRRTRIQELRALAGLTVRQAAEKVGMSASGWVQYELGRRSPNVHRALQIARVLGTTVEDLFGSEVDSGGDKQCS